MASLLLGVLEATQDLNTSLDECLLDGDEQIKGDVVSLAAECRALLEKEKANLVQLPSEDLIELTLREVESLRRVGDDAAKVELTLAAKLDLWRPKIEQVKAVESELEELDQLAAAIKSLARSRKLLDILKGSSSTTSGTFSKTPAIPVTAPEVKAEALLELIAIKHRSSIHAQSKAGNWLSARIAEFLPIVRSELEAEIGKVSKTVSWPIPPEELDGANSSLLCRFVSLLVRLQVFAGGDAVELAMNEVVNDVWGIKLLARPSVLRFQFHFCSDRTTNRVDRPEWFVAFLIKCVRDTAPFIETKLQPALAVLEHRSSSLHPSSASHGAEIVVDALSQFIRQLVHMVYVRLDSNWKVLEHDDALICHTMDELLAGDRTLAGEFGYGSCAKWPTMSAFFFTTDERVSSWLKADLRYARARLNEICESKTCWQTLGQAIRTSTTPTTSPAALQLLLEDKEFTTEFADAAMVLIDALGSRIDMCKLDDERELGIRTQFVEEVQCALIKDVALLALKRPTLSERLSTLFPMQETLLDWRVKPRYASIRKSPNSKIGKKLLLFGGSQNGVGHSDDMDEDDGEVAWVFYSHLEYLRKLVREELDAESNRVGFDIIKSMRDWEKKSWTTAGDVNSDLNREMSQEIRAALSICKSNLQSWKRAIHPVLVGSLVAGLARELETHLLEYIRKRTFSIAGALQLRYDCTAMAEMFTPFNMGGAIVRPAIDKFFPRLALILKLLTKEATALKRLLADGGIGEETQQEGSNPITLADVKLVAKIRVDI